MAIYNEILVGRFSKAIQKVFGMKGSSAAKQVSGEIMPVFPLKGGIEHAYFEGFNTFQSEVQIAAGGAATFAALLLRNPANSFVVAVVEKLSARAPANADDIQVWHGTNNTDLLTAQTPERLDARSGASGINGSCVLTSGVPAAPIAALRRIDRMINTSQIMLDFVKGEWDTIPIFPGDSLEIITGTANTGEGYVIRWRERPLDQGELVG